MSAPSVLSRPGRAALAYHKISGRVPGVMFLGGFMSDMTGTKAVALESHCRDSGRAFLRFDYSGHGASGGRFDEGTLSGWRQDALDAFDALTEGPQILVGSSMGGWVALLVALARPERVAGLVGIAAAPDFTEDLMWPGMTETEREALLRDGRIQQPTMYGDVPYVITRDLIEDGRRHLLLRGPVPIDAPVRLLQGMRDPDVPWRTALRIADALTGGDVRVELVKDGDHRLSRPQDLARITALVDELAAHAERG